ncbi:protein FAR-RED IMPAIRED RESPONSE 1-like [Lotus japonicus]|uniref:protein FAR-RED IMPAIRED RESPONSE 1-like n=1 Tax=Lotus japonicus TaxID=34305 RepID=UPI00258A3C56|nr:protein FAR-RED IMPAIRED RESPONSE 1-like [Lotus japonicus]
MEVDAVGVEESEELESLACTGEQIPEWGWNYIAKVRQLKLGVGDAKALRNYFTRMQRRNSNFFYVIDMDDDSHLRNVFWADARSRAAYDSFGDIVSFDSTYLTNRYNIPFSPFVGVNHNGQSILFGCGLLSREDKETYVWLFKSRMECMRGRAPKAITTYQCRSIQAAVAEAFMNLIIIFFLWHIMKKVPHKLSGLTQYKEIKKTLKTLVYDSIEASEFDDGWHKMVDDYCLQENELLSSFFSDRGRWVPVYVKSIFWAGMSTTLRSESMNAFFDGYVNSKTSLGQFVQQYDNALKSKMEKENKADFDFLNSSYQLITSSHFEKQFKEAYNNTIFKSFQDELRDIFFAISHCLELMV